MIRRERRYAIILILIAIVCSICFLNCRYKLYVISFPSENGAFSNAFTIMSFNVNATDSVEFDEDIQSRLLDLIKQEKQISYVFKNCLSKILKR